MSLLTEKQIKEILLIIENEVNVEWPDTMLEMLCEWNEKQTTQQFEPDWSKAPDDATSAVLSLTWITKGSWAFGYNIAEYERPAPVITPHPHAEMLAKYAEVAARRSDPWVEFELYSEPFDDWVALETPTFFDTLLKYRHVGDAK